MSCASADEFCDIDDMAVMMGIDPDQTEANESTSEEEAAPPVADKNPTTATEKIATEKEHVDVTVTESLSAQTRSKTVKMATASIPAQKLYTIREYTKHFNRKHSKTTKIRNSQPPIVFFRPKMQMPNTGVPAIFFVEGVNCQFNSGVNLLCPGRTFRFDKSKTYVVLGCIWIGCRRPKKTGKFSCIKPVYTILVFEDELSNAQAVVYKCKITSLYSKKTLLLDNTISQKLIDAAGSRFTNMLKLHGRTRTYWDNLTTVGEPVCKDIKPPQSSSKPKPKPKLRTKRIRRRAQPKQEPDVRYAGSASPASWAVTDLLQQLGETKSELADVRSVVKSSNEAVAALTKNVADVLARDREQQHEANTSRTPKRKRKRKHSKRKHRAPSSSSTSPSSSSQCTDSPSPARRSTRRRRHSRSRQYMSPLMMYSQSPAFMGTPPFIGSPSPAMNPQMMMMYNYQQQNMMYDRRR